MKNVVTDTPGLLKAPPGPSEFNSPDAFKDPLQFLLQLSRDYGDVVQFPSAYGPVCLVNHPQYIADILHDSEYARVSLHKMVLGEGVLTSEGSYWRRQRRLIQPAFHRECLARMDSLITDTTQEMLQGWRAFHESEQPVNVDSEMSRLTLRIVGKALFSFDFVLVGSKISEAMTACMECLSEFWIFSSSQNLTSSFHLRFSKALQTIDKVVFELIKNRRQNGANQNDLLDLLLAARTENGQPLSDRQVRDEVVTLLLAGHETTANVLAWTWFLLAENPAVEHELHREVAVTIGKNTANSQNLVKLAYAKMIIQESMRLYPPVWIFFRKAPVDRWIGEYFVPANCMVALSAYAMHRNPRYWHEPDRFDPQRFSLDCASELPHYAYFPFGGGPHLCMGNHFAMQEATLVLATVAQHYRLRRVPGHPVETMPLITLRLRHGLRMNLEPRT